ncbi:serine/threonine-protein kinase [Streptomyces sp. CAI-155]|uniref:serine/threonine-protein kinase n=1 Tax=Streptomyces sp. CAI-155 TaxID=1472660 RepID=UPI001587476B|nr:serine/threonine-protein kinase [Streptomyces sp. CAI-155]NUV81235.1 serine/threonine protein kinase [Streptomyces sp. CAI-155]
MSGGRQQHGDERYTAMEGIRPLVAGDPDRIGPYPLLGRLGAGGMGRVYLARSAGGRTVAVKVVHEEHISSGEFRARFRREIETARRVGGRYTAPVLDADPDADRPWVATGYVPGPSLEQAVREHGQLPADSVHALAEGLLRALRGIHAAGIVHRDLKPSNVLLTVDGPRIIDFGIARALQVSVESLLTSTGMVIGSPGFMAPEQILGEETGTGADVFALGCVLMYAATGQLPFGNGASNQHAVMYRIVESAPDLTGVGDAPLRELIGRCLTKKPAERPGVEVLLADIGTSESPGAALRGGAWLPPQLLARLARQAAVLLDADVPGAEVAGTSGAVGGAGAAGAGEASVARPDVATADLRPEPVGGAEVGAGGEPVRDPRAEAGPVPEAGAGPVPVCVPEAERAPEAEGVREPGAEAVREPGAAAGWEPVRDPKAEAVRASEADPGPKGAAGAEAAPEVAPGASPAPACPPPSALVVSAGESGGKAPRRRRRMWVVAAAVLAVLATGSTVAFLQHRPGGGADGRDTDAAAPAGTGDGPSAPPSAGPTGGGEDEDDKDGKGKEKPEKEGDGDGKGQEKGETSGSGGAGEASASGGGGSGSGGSDGSAASASGGSGSGAPGGGSGSGSGAGGSGSGSGSSSGSGSGSGSGTASKPPTTDPDPPATDNRVPQHFVGTWTRASQYDALQPHTVVIRRAAPGQVAVTLIADVQGTGHCEYTAKLTSVADGGQRINVGTATVDKARSTGMCRDGDPSFYTVAGSGILHDVGPAHGSGYRYNRA